MSDPSTTAPLSENVQGETVAPAQLAQPTDAIAIAKMLQNRELKPWKAGDLARANGLSSTDVAKALSILGDASRANQSAPIEPSSGDMQMADQEQMRAAYFSAKAAPPESFSFPYAAPGEPPPTMSPELKSFDTNARGWLSEAGFDQTLGNSFATVLDREERRIRNMTDVEWNAYEQQEWSKLERAYGEQLKDKLNQAALMVDVLEAQRPGLRQMIKASGAFCSALVVSMMIQQAERFHARRGAK